MHLLNEEGRFQFIKNQQVEIDKTLKKYQEIELIKKAKKEQVESTPDDPDSSFTLGNTGVLMDATTDIDVDNDLRELINGITTNSVLEFFKSEDAKEFNKKFIKILTGEVDMNRYSLQVTNSRWRQETVASYVNITNESVSFSYTEPQPDKPVKNPKLKAFIRDINEAFSKLKKPKKNFEEDDFNVLEFFSILHVIGGKEREFIDRIGGYFQLFENARKMNQIAQMDMICQKIIIDIYESVLYVNGYNKYIEFGTLEQIKSKGGRLIDIDYIKNFGRTIPTEVVEKKVQCDEMCVFDNYCVMYYDPEGGKYKSQQPGHQPTSKAKRDPILFGLINHSDKLYYVADWEDELCDLTLEKIAEKCTVGEIK